MGKNYIFIGLVFLVLVYGVFYYQISLMNQNNQILLFDANPSNEGTAYSFPWISLGITCFFTITGIFFGSFYYQIKNKDVISSYKKEFYRLFKSTHLIRALLVAPIIFVGVYKATNTNPDKVLAALLAFQNGFFCDSILRKKDEKTP